MTWAPTEHEASSGVGDHDAGTMGPGMTPSQGSSLAGGGAGTVKELYCARL
jgi:hypothetical protein